MTHLVTVILGLFLATLPAKAYLTILESGEPVGVNEYHLGFAPQFVSGEASGTNAVFVLRKGLDEGRDFSVQVGSGAVDLWTTLATRWIPIPDVDNQPAIGLRFDVTLVRETNASGGSFRVAPFISKRYRTDVADLEPYAYVPLGFSVSEGKYDNMSNLVIGSQFRLEDLRPVYFYGETAFNMRNSVSYFTIGVFSTFER